MSVSRLIGAIMPFIGAIIISWPRACRERDERCRVILLLAGAATPLDDFAKVALSMRAMSCLIIADYRHISDLRYRMQTRCRQMR